MNQLRQPFSELSPEVYKGLVQASIALEKSELGNALVELVYLRVSQINGCAFCLEKHSQALRKGGSETYPSGKQLLPYRPLPRRYRRLVVAADRPRCSARGAPF